MTTGNTPELVKRWKVRTSELGTVLTLNGKEYELGTSGPSIAFAIAAMTARKDEENDDQSEN